MNDLRRGEGYTVAAEYESARQVAESARAKRVAWAKAAKDEGASLAEMADVLGVSVGTVQAILGRRNRKK